MRFNVQRDKEHIFLGAAVTDDRVVDGKDLLVLLMDTRRIADQLNKPELGDGAHIMRVAAVSDSNNAEILSTKVGKAEIKTAVMGTPKGYNVEAAIPIKSISDRQGDDWHSFQYTMYVRDVDDPKEQPVSVLWRGTSEPTRRNTNYAHFVRDE